MNQKVGLNAFGGTECDFVMRTVHKGSGLESYDLPPSQPSELGTEDGRCLTQMTEIVVAGKPHAFDASTNAERMRVPKKVGHTGMFETPRSVDHLGFGLPVGLPDFLDVESGEHDAFRVSEREYLTGFELASELLRNIEGNGDGPHCAVG
jgi:hypothetical protein